MQRMIESYRQRRNFVIHALRAAGLDCHEPAGAFYAFPNIESTGMTSSEFAEKLIMEEKVAVVPGHVFGESGEGHVRCSYATSIDNLREAMARIARFVARHKKNKSQSGDETAGELKNAAFRLHWQRANTMPFTSKGIKSTWGRGCLQTSPLPYKWSACSDAKSKHGSMYFHERPPCCLLFCRAIMSRCHVSIFSISAPRARKWSKYWGYDLATWCASRMSNPSSERKPTTVSAMITRWS